MGRLESLPHYPVSMVVMVVVSLLAKKILFESDNPYTDQETLWIKFAGATSLGIIIWIADRLGKQFQVPPQRFAGPVAFSCALALFILLPTVTLGTGTHHFHTIDEFREFLATSNVLLHIAQSEK